MEYDFKSDHSKEHHFVTDQFAKPQPFKSPNSSASMYLLKDNHTIIHNYELLIGQQGLRKE